jgi:hypothetical protein
MVVTVVGLSLPLAGSFVSGSSDVGASDPAGTSYEADGYRASGHLGYVVDAKGPGQLTVVNRTSGERIFRTSEHDLYHDVDRSPAGKYTLLYVASIVNGEGVCPDRFDGLCTRNVVERVNYSTGETERIYSRYLNYNGSSNTHDVDRTPGGDLLVGDIQFDRAYVADLANGTEEWEWRADSEFALSSGGKPDDWTHLNDVEVVEPGLYMVNLRNQDQVVFVDREEGMRHDWTLGADDDHEVLYEQHNPDYVPEERGGPAVVVADSENNRIVEYQRVDGEWERSWVWTDVTLQWPRDADRLPNNNTLVTDTHGTRLLEVSPNGTVLWERTVPRGVYEAELLTTGDESAGGRSMSRIRGDAEQTDVSAVEGVDGRLQKAFLGLFPPLVLHGFLYVLPTWVTPLAGALLLVDLVLVVLWGVGEGVLLVRRRRLDAA